MKKPSYDSNSYDFLIIITIAILILIGFFRNL